MNPQIRKYYTLIVHHGDPLQTQRALLSLNNCDLPSDEIIVIDHAKRPFKQTGPPNHIVIRPKHNNGYAAGINIGLGVLLSRGAKAADIVVVMNNDVTVYPATFKELRKWWCSHPQDALLGVVTEETQGTVTRLSHIDLVTGRTHLGRQPPLRSYTLPYIHGAFFVAPYKVFMQTQGIAEHFFLYWEDACLSTRAVLRGVPLRFAPRVRVEHHHNPTPAKLKDELYYLVRNGALFLEQETPWPWRRYWWVRNRLRLIYHTIRAGNPAVRQALNDARHRITGPHYH